MTVTDIILSLHYITVVIVTCDTILILNSNPKFLIKKIKWKIKQSPLSSYYDLHYDLDLKLRWKIHSCIK